MRFNLSIAEMIVLGAAFAGILAWGWGIENRVDDIERGIKGEVKSAVEEAIAPFSTSFVPSGAVMAYVGEETSAPVGWEICGRGEGNFPSLEGRFLVGTHHFDSVGIPIGSPSHDHSVSIRSTPERDGHESREPEGADNRTNFPNWSHRHHVEGNTTKADHIPPAVQVLFFCKQ